MKPIMESETQTIFPKNKKKITKNINEKVGENPDLWLVSHAV
jgi:hypothetical protein